MSRRYRALRWERARGSRPASRCRAMAVVARGLGPEQRATNVCDAFYVFFGVVDVVVVGFVGEAVVAMIGGVVSTGGDVVVGGGGAVSAGAAVVVVGPFWVGADVAGGRIGGVVSELGKVVGAMLVGALVVVVVDRGGFVSFGAVVVATVDRS